MSLLNDLTGNFLGGLVSTKQLDTKKLGSLGGFDGSKGDISSDQFNFAKYDVGSLTYPSDLLSNENKSLASKNYVMFFINVSTDSRVLKTNKEEVFQGDVSRTRSQLLSEGITQKGFIGAAAAEGALKGTGVKLISDITGVGKLSGAAAAGIGAALQGGAAALIASKAATGDAPPGEEKQPQFTRPQKRLKKAIALYVPHNLKVNYGVNYEGESTAEFSAKAGIASEVLDALDSKSKGSLKNAVGIGGDFLASKILAGSAGASVTTGLAANPKKEQVFQGVNFREFTFNYTFAPRNEAEAQIVRNIIYEFKYHMHPEFLSPSAFVYVYPSEFDIEYYSGTKLNPNIHKHTSCVLTNMEVDYAPNNNFVTFPNGMPTQINLTLTFKELLSLTKETIERLEKPI